MEVVTNSKYVSLSGIAPSIQSNSMRVSSKPFFQEICFQVCTCKLTGIYILESPILKEGTLFKVYIYTQKIYQNVLMFAIC